MKIGIIWSGNDMLTLFNFLHRYNYEYIVWYDSLFWPWWDKWFDFALSRVKEWIKFLKSKWVDKIIIPPVYELAFSDDSSILKLFSGYISDYCIKYSLVWKIWFVGDFSDVEVCQKLFKNYLNKVKTKSSLSFSYWVKEVQMWKYFLTTFSYSNFMVNKTVKFDLHYFKDANIDTLIPLNYGYFNFQKIFLKFFNFKKTRFHRLEKLEETFSKLILWFLPSNYSVSIYYTGDIKLLERDKKIMWLLYHWKSIDIFMEKCILC